MGTMAKQHLHITGLDTYYFTVTDAKASAAWYIRHFGLTGAGSGEGAETLRLAEGALLTLVEQDRLTRYDAVPIQFKTHDARKAYEALDRTAVDADEPRRFHHYTDFDVRDPDGNKFNVISDPDWPDTPNNYFKIDGAFIGVADIERCVAWFDDVLGADVEYDFTYPTDSLPEARHVCYLGLPVSLVESPKGECYHRVCEYATSDAAADRAALLGKGVRVTALRENEEGKSFSFFDLDDREYGMIERAFRADR